MKSLKEDKSPRTRRVLVQSIGVLPEQNSNISFQFNAKRMGTIRIFFEYEDEVTLFDVNEFKIQ